MFGRTLLLSLLLSVTAQQANAAVLHVNAAANGPVTNGLSWETAFRKMQEGIEASSAGDELWIAAGEYREPLLLKDGVTLLGGFAGTETERSQRNWNKHKTILSGNGSGRVLTLEHPATQPTRVDGFVIRDGVGNYGSGVYLAGGNVIFANNLVIGNQAAGPHSGAGIFVDESGILPERPLLTLFTTISDQLLKNYSEELSSSNIPLYPTNRYDAEVHRLLQVAANICDATTNRGDVYPFYPSVFRPVFTNDNGTIAIAGYVEANDAHFISNTWLDLDLATDRALLASDEVRSNANLHGQAIIIGAKKGWPNFNEFSLETIAEVSRRLEIRKPNSQPSTQPNETNQMYTLSITNVFGVEAWNAYTQNFTRPIELHVRHSFSAGLTNRDGYLIAMPDGNPRHIISESEMLVTNWSKVMTLGQYPLPEAFKIPFKTGFSLLPPSRYVGNPPGFDSPTNAFQRNQGFQTPSWHLVMTNRLQYFAVENNRVVDFVNLDKLTTYIDLSRTFFLLSNDLHPSDAMSLLWDTNTVNHSTLSVPRGIHRQIEYSLTAAINFNQWNAYSPTPLTQNEYMRGIDQFRFFMGETPIFGPSNNLVMTNRIQVPLVAWKKKYFRHTLQVNDPFVRYRIDDLLDSATHEFSFEVLPSRPDWQISVSNIGYLNERFRPYFYWSWKHTTNPFRFEGEWHQPSSLLQDNNIHWSEDWNFPSGSILNLTSLDRIHRGTPWQTLYTGSHSFQNVNWRNWSGSALTHPTNDWQIIQTLLTNKSAFVIAKAVPTSPTLVNNTFANNSSPAPGAAVAMLSSGTMINNIAAGNSSGLWAVASAGEINAGRNNIAANFSQNLWGIDNDDWNITADPQFVSAGNHHLLATSPSVDAADESVFTTGLLLNEPARKHGAGLDLGAYELSPDDAPVLRFSTAPGNPSSVSLRVTAFNNQSYVIERSGNLVDWTPVFTNITANGFFDLADTASDTNRFYRAVRHQ